MDDMLTAAAAGHSIDRSDAPIFFAIRRQVSSARHTRVPLRADSHLDCTVGAISDTMREKFPDASFAQGARLIPQHALTAFHFSIMPSEHARATRTDSHAAGRHRRQLDTSSTPGADILHAADFGFAIMSAIADWLRLPRHARTFFKN